MGGGGVMSDFQDRAYAESVSFTRGALIGALVGGIVEALVVGTILTAVWS